MMQIVVGNTLIYADGYIPVPKENAIRFYKKKSVLDYIPPIEVNADMLSNSGKEILCR